METRARDCGPSSLLINEIDDLPERFILVLDDYHYIHAPAIHKLLDSILRHPPLQMHLLIASRSEPPLALARLRANVRLNELRSKDLRFTQDETENFLAQAFGGEIDAHATDLLARRGTKVGSPAYNWRCCRCARRKTRVLCCRISSAESTDSLWTTCLNKCCSNSPLRYSAFLVKTSILDRISPDLALTLIDPGERPTGTLSSAQLEHAGLFVNVMDDAGEWFSYHALFRELLRHHLRTRIPAGTQLRHLIAEPAHGSANTG